MKEVIETELLSKKSAPTYGGSRIEAEYSLTHKINGKTNHYTLTFEVRITQEFNESCYLNLIQVERHNNNEETLTDEGVESLLDKA